MGSGIGSLFAARSIVVICDHGYDRLSKASLTASQYGCCLLLSLLSSIFSARFFDTLGLHYCRHNNPLEVCQRKSASNYTQQDETDEMVMMDRRRMAYDAVFLSRMERELMRHGPKSLIDS